MQHKLLQYKRSQPKKAAYEVKPLAMQCNFNQGGTPLWLCFYNDLAVWLCNFTDLKN